MAVSSRCTSRTSSDRGVRPSRQQSAAATPAAWPRAIMLPMLLPAAWPRNVADAQRPATSRFSTPFGTRLR